MIIRAHVQTAGGMLRKISEIRILPINFNKFHVYPDEV